MLKKVRLFCCAGEPSGDNLAAAFLEKFCLRYPQLSLEGIFGPKVEALGFRPFTPMRAVAYNGIWDVWRHLPSLLKIYYAAKKRLTREGISLALLVDFPGFNRGLLQTCRKLQIPTYFMAPPQVWPYRYKNITAFAGAYVHILYPMDLKPYQKIGAHCTLGHFYPKPSHARVSPTPLICLCPGSRTETIKRTLPLMCQKILQSKLVPSAFELALHLPRDEFPLAESLTKNFKWPGRVTFEENLNLLGKKCFLALSVPGTISLELALAGIPSIILAPVDLLTLTVGRLLLKTRFLSLPSALLEKEYFPEMVGTRKALNKISLDPYITRALKQKPDLKMLWEKMGPAQGAEAAVRQCTQLLKGA